MKFRLNQSAKPEREERRMTKRMVSIGTYRTALITCTVLALITGLGLGYNWSTHTSQSDLEAHDKGQKVFDSLVADAAIWLDTLAWHCDCCGIWLPFDPTDYMPAVDTSVSYNVDVFIQDNRTKEHWMNAGVAIYQGSLLYVEGSTDHNGLVRFYLPEGSYQIVTRIKKGNVWGLLIDVTEDRCDTISISEWPQNLNHEPDTLDAIRPIGTPRVPLHDSTVGMDGRDSTLTEEVDDSVLKSMYRSDGFWTY